MKNIINIMFLVAILMVTTLVSSPLTTNAIAVVSENTVEVCFDAVDNDGDLLVDSSDPDCAPFYGDDEEEFENTYELCHDEVDNDGDELTDASDSDCDPFYEDDNEEYYENTYGLCHDEVDNDDDLLVDSSDPDCAPFYQEEIATTTPPVEEEAPRRRSGSRRNTGGSSVPSTGSVLGAFDSNSCSEYITSYIKFGQANNSADVSRLQTFLNEFLKTNLVVSGEYDQPTFDAVKKLQDTYSNEILKPWVDAGLMKSAVSTGYVYKTTRWFINNIKCSGTPFPLLP
jgi:hypothetical protein